MIADAKKLLEMSQAELDRLYRESQPGPIPEGRAEGTAIVAPRTLFGNVARPLIRWFFWRGKVFDPAHRDLKNRLLPFGIKAIRAKVYVGESWLANGEAIVLDYSKTSFVAQKIRDEIRQVRPGLYLGQVFWGKRRIALFTLQFPTGAPS